MEPRPHSRRGHRQGQDVLDPIAEAVAATRGGGNLGADPGRHPSPPRDP
jgi:hypothetical protein